MASHVSGSLGPNLMGRCAGPAWQRHGHGGAPAAKRRWPKPGRMASGLRWISSTGHGWMRSWVHSKAVAVPRANGASGWCGGGWRRPRRRAEAAAGVERRRNQSKGHGVRFWWVLRVPMVMLSTATRSDVSFACGGRGGVANGGDELLQNRGSSNRHGNRREGEGK